MAWTDERIDDFVQEMREFRRETREDFRELRGDVASLRTDVTRLVFGLYAAMFVQLIAVLIAIFLGT